MANRKLATTPLPATLRPAPLFRPILAERWLLKSPQHLEQVPVLNRVFPDSIVVFTHRDPVPVVLSMLAMLSFAGGWIILGIGALHIERPVVATPDDPGVR